VYIPPANAAGFDTSVIYAVLAWLNISTVEITHAELSGEKE
jgi:hypothetical protein